MTKSLIGTRCENHDVRLLAWTRWDKEAKRWKVTSSHNIAYCRNCQDVISIRTGKRYRKKRPVPPDLAKRNGLAAERARATIAAYTNFAGEEDRFKLGEFLADLLHYNDRYSSGHTDFNAAVEYAEGYYLDDTSGD